ncbi:MAG: hypothetical protein HQL43_07045 [Alphaproteobacteria bacterium]|nr:hypothetical protein [Alphaproteobacteria bacterium]
MLEPLTGAIRQTTILCLPWAQSLHFSAVFWRYQAYRFDINFGLHDALHQKHFVRIFKAQEMTDNELIAEIEAQKSLMIAVATGGPRIQDVNQQYADRRERISEELRIRCIEDVNPHGDLWAWYGRWSAGDMPTWATRRAYLSEMHQPLIDQIRLIPRTLNATLFDEPTGWLRVDRGIYEIRRRLEQAQYEEHFQAIGLLCREALISLAQVVYDPLLHPSDDGTVPSGTDGKRMLDSFIAVELAGNPNEGVRRHTKAALSLANDLQHHRTADYRQAAICAEATTSVVNIIAIISRRRDPSC